MSNFVPNEEKTIHPSEPPWFTDSIRKSMDKNEKIYKRFKLNGYKDEDKAKVEQNNSNVNEAILKAKEKYQ